MKTNDRRDEMQTEPTYLRSGADARAEGKVAEYADHMKKKLLEMGQTEEQAEANRQKILKQFGSSTTTNGGNMTTQELAQTYRDALNEWKTTGSADSADALAEIENEVCGHLDIPLDETEQGLTDYAVSVIDDFVAANA